MKFSPSIFAVPTTLVAVLFLANCSSDAPAAPPAGGSSNAAGSAGKTGVAGSSGGSVSAGGAGAGGSGAGGSSAGGSSAGGSSAAGSAGAGTAGGAAVDASFNTVRTVIGTKCNGGNGCHGQADNPLPMANDDKLYATLMAHTTEKCGKVINTASPADSALIKLMLGDCNGTPRMPRQQCWDGDKPEDNEFCVPTATVNAIQAWIAKGAPQQ